MVSCKNCGLEAKENAKFCKNCGTKLEIEEEKKANKTNVCSSCGSDVEEDAKFYKNCGTEIIIEEEKNTNSKFCANCGFEMDAKNKFCPECGFTTNASPKVDTPVTKSKSNKNSVLAAILSFFIPGLGQFYLNQIRKGIILFICAMIGSLLISTALGWIIYLIVWGYGIYDAYNTAEKMKNEITVEDKIDFNNLF